MTLGERLKTLRKSKHLTQQQLADQLQINRATYAKYETGSHQPDYETLRRMADFFFVSVDYLIGRTDDPRPPRSTPHPDSSLRVEFPSRLRDAREKRSLSIEVLAAELELNPACIASLEASPGRLPTVGTLRRLADRLGVTPAYLVGDVDDPSDPGPDEAWYQPKELIHILRDSEVMFDGVLLSDADKQRIQDVLTGLFWESIQKNRERKKRAPSPPRPPDNQQ